MQEIQQAQAVPLLRRFWQGLGPGLVTGAADDDPSGIATHSQIGAQFGYALSWTFVLSFPLMVVIQEVAAQIGRVTGSWHCAQSATALPAVAPQIGRDTFARREHH